MLVTSKGVLSANTPLIGIAETSGETNCRYDSSPKQPKKGKPDSGNGETLVNESIKKRVKQDELVKLAVDVELFCDVEGNGELAYASIPVNNHIETYPIKSGAFRRWLTNEYVKKYRQAVSTQPMQNALDTLESMASCDGPRHRVFTRIGELNGKIYYDLGNEEWQVVEVDSDGWRILDKSPVKFFRPRGNKAQLSPVRGGTLDELRKFINIQSQDDWILFGGWLISCFRASGPYLFLSFAGTQDAAKSTSTKMVRLLVDPSTALVRGQPREDRDLMVGAKNNFMLAFDNLSYISESFSDSLCRLSTGGGQASRENYTNGSEYLFDAMRPVVMNGIEELATRPDLVDRTVTAFLPSLSDEKRMDEKELYAQFEKSIPRILGAIFDAISCAIKNWPHTRLPASPRMADATRFITAAEPALGWEQGTFWDIYNAYRRTAKINGLEASNIGSALCSLMDENQFWEGTATQLLEELDLRLPKTAGRKNFPSSARAMSGALRRLVPSLKEVGILVQLPEGARRNGGKVARTIRLENSHPPEGDIVSNVETYESVPF